MRVALTGKRRALPAGWNVALAAAGLALGLSLAIDWQGVAALPPDAPGARARVAEALQQAEQEQVELKATIASLRKELADAQRQASQQSEQMARVRADLEREQTLGGLVPLRGPGVIVTLDDSTMPPSPAASADDYIIHDGDLRDVVNLLWNGGAEAIAINDERLVHSTSIVCVGAVVMVNDTRMSPPYLVRAIGDRRAMEALVNDPAYLTFIRQRARAYGIELSVAGSNAVEVSAYSGTLSVRYANTGEVKP